MTGIELAKHLAVEQPRVKMMFMTGYADDRAVYERATRLDLIKGMFRLPQLAR